MKSNRPLPGTELISSLLSTVAGPTTLINTAGVRTLALSIFIKLRARADTVLNIADGLITVPVFLFRDEVFEFFVSSANPLVVTNDMNLDYYYCLSDFVEKPNSIAANIWLEYQALINADQRIGSGCCPILRKT